MTVDADRLAACRAEAEHLLAIAEHVLPRSNSVAALLAWHGRELLARGLTPTHNHRAAAQTGYEAAAYVQSADQMILTGQPRSSASTDAGLPDVARALAAVGSTPPGGSEPITADRDRFFYVDLVDDVWRRPSLSVSRAEAEVQVQFLRDAIHRLDL